MSTFRGSKRSFGRATVEPATEESVGEASAVATTTTRGRGQRPPFRGRGRGSRGTKRQRPDIPAPALPPTPSIIPPASTSSGLSPLTDAAFVLTFTPRPTRSNVTYVPDMNGLAALAHHVWIRFSTSKYGAVSIRSFSESMFMFAVLQVAVLGWMEIARKCDSLDPFFLSESIVLSMLTNLPGTLVPKFVADWIALLGRVVGSDGTRFRLQFPAIRPTTDSDFNIPMIFERSYATSLPCFRALARVIRNEVANDRNWDDFRTTFGDPPTDENPPFLTDAHKRKFPGLHSPVQAMSSYVRQAIINFNDQIEIEVNDGTFSALDVIQVNPGNQTFGAYMQAMFARLNDDGMECVRLDESMLSSTGSEALLYWSVPDNSINWDEFQIRTLLHTADPGHGENARAFKHIVRKGTALIVHAVEQRPERFDASLAPSVSFTMGSPSYSNSAYLGRLVERYIRTNQ